MSVELLPPRICNIMYKLPTQELAAMRMGDDLPNPVFDSPNQSGTTSSTEWEVPFEIGKETYEIFYRSAGEQSQGPVVALTYTGIDLNLNTTMDSSVLTVIVDKLSTFVAANVIVAPAYIEIGTERLLVTNVVDNGATWSLTVIRAALATTAAAHTAGATVSILQLPFGIVHKTIVLDSLSAALPAPTSLTTSVVVPGLLTLSWSGGLTDNQDKQLRRFVVYYSQSTIAAFDPNNDPVPGGVTRVELGREEIYNFQPGDTSTYYFRVTAQNLVNIESSLSAETSNAAGEPAEGLDLTTPDAPTINFVSDGGSIESGFQFVYGVAFSSGNGQNSASAIQFMVAKGDYVFNSTNGFTSGKARYQDGSFIDEIIGPPPVLDRITLFGVDAFSFTARIQNGVTSTWGPWATPVTDISSYGTPDSDTPGVTSPILKVEDSAESLGNGIRISYRPDPSDSNTMYALAVRIADSLWPQTIEGAIGTNTIHETGTAETVAGKLTFTVSIDLTGKNYAGKTIVFYDTLNANGKWKGCSMWIIESNTASTVTIERNLKLGGFNETNAAKNFYIVDPINQYRHNRLYVESAEAYFENPYNPNQGFIIDHIPLTGSAIIAVKAANAIGEAQWIYWDGGTGTTNRLNAVAFTPQLLQTAAVEDGAILSAKQSYGTQIVGSDVVFTPDGTNSHRQVNWTAGNVYLPDGTSEAVNSGNTGLLTTNTTYWIYKNIGPSASATLAVTSSIANALGDNKFILAQIRTTSDSSEVLSIVGPFVDGLTISAEVLNVNQLSAITADVGELTAGIITGVIIRTSASNPMVKLTSANGIEAIDSGGTTLVQIPTTGTQILFTAGGSQGGDGSPPGSGAGFIKFGSGAYIFQDSTNVVHMSDSNWDSAAGDPFKVGFGNLEILAAGVSSSANVYRSRDTKIGSWSQESYTLSGKEMFAGILTATGTGQLNGFGEPWAQLVADHPDESDTRIKVYGGHGSGSSGRVFVEIDSVTLIDVSDTQILMSETVRIDGDLGINRAPSVNIDIEDSDPTIRMHDTGATGYSQLAIITASFIIDIDPSNVDASSLFQVNIDNAVVVTVSASGDMTLVGDFLSQGGLHTVRGNTTANYVYYEVDVLSSNMEINFDSAGTATLGEFRLQYNASNFLTCDGTAIVLDSFDVYLENSLHLRLSGANRGVIYTDEAGTTDRLIIGGDGVAIDFLITGNIRNINFSPTGGVTIGSPTGSYKGAGTLNAQAVYANDTLLTDFVFQDNYNLISIQEMREFFVAHKHLPTIDGREVWEREGGFSLGKLSTQLWETVECHAIYIANINDEVQALRDRLSKLELYLQ